MTCYGGDVVRSILCLKYDVTSYTVPTSERPLNSLHQNKRYVIEPALWKILSDWAEGISFDKQPGLRKGHVEPRYMGSTFPFQACRDLVQVVCVYNLTVARG